jgi:hypothetical protein
VSNRSLAAGAPGLLPNGSITAAGLGIQEAAAGKK